MPIGSHLNGVCSKMSERRMFDLRGKRVWVAGHRGLVGSAVVRRLADEPCQVLTAGREEADLRDGSAVDALIARMRPDAIVLAAARVGGILANDTRPAEFLYDNLAIAANVIHAAARHEVGKLLFLGSSCIYPRAAKQPISEDALLSGPLEPTNEWYAIAKIAGLKLCQAYRRQHGLDFISAMPCNLYGPGDNFDLASSHVIPALIAKVREAQETGTPYLEVWGSGRPRREFLYVDDLADALVFLLRNYSDEPPVNVGTGEDITIAGLARDICEVAGFRGGLRFETSRPDGTPRKVLDVSRLDGQGWHSRIGLREGLERTWRWYLRNTERKPARVAANF
jgi:GDP-L-fucose synthase